VTEGLLFVLAEPGEVPLAEFHEWYDADHAPARVAVPGVHAGQRFAAVDDGSPGWLAVYPLRLDALDSAEYASARVRSPYERTVVERLATLDRRIYRRLDAPGPPAPGPASLLLTVGMTSTDPGALEEWYLREHLPLLRAVPGWRRATRFRRLVGGGPDHLTVHELTDASVFDDAGYRRAVSTPWREEIMATVVAYERRLFAHHRTVTTAGP
jgi:hypothetical protein